MLRREYEGQPFDPGSADPDPFKQFSNWFDDAVSAIKHDPNAMTLSTADKNGRPSSRTVLLKEYDETGFVFYTNYKSRKGSQIMNNPNVSLTFYWPDLMRQIHIEGTAQKIPETRSDAYFRLRPGASKLSAWASEQSSEIESREELENKLKKMEQKFKGDEIPRPPHWGGFLVQPHRMEFWQGRLNRLHDRICYIKEQNSWSVKRLSP